MVEQNRGGNYTQIVYSPSGAKLALMNQQTLSKAFVPLPGGATAVYTNGSNGVSLTYYRHPDWLGSSRLATTPNRTVYSYSAYAPFGEPYGNGALGQGSNLDFSFTGQDQDTVSGTLTNPSPGLYDFPFREYSPAQGRWISPDPAGLQAVDMTNPQSWNRYAYALNNPLANVDPDGLDTNCELGPEGILICKNWTLEPSSPPNLGGIPGVLGGCLMLNIDGQSSRYVYVGPGNPPPGTPCAPGGTLPGTGRQAGGAGAPANNGRNCTVSPASTGQYVVASAQVVAMTSEFFSGLGPGNLTFAPGSATSQVMAQSPGVQEVLNSYYMTGQTSGLYTFGISGLEAARANPVAQFVGSFRWSITPVNGGINLSLTNTTSFKSLTYDVGPQCRRRSFPTPMGNTHQTYNITAKCQ